ncbi:MULTISPECIES: septum formation initiator family protein [Actinomadura]|uniref:Septum formation initiator family protein n=1 Tax=Actinomadura litoris TaxID=2678616 RepID=A0A7K1L6B6_9ACTN|nr:MULTISPECIES: septum formation initiator family protein [Actinomadura]MBT2213889.1 septum formation initiator family protein [Actinomadura sp. NEAU-AAG7]MUN39950.1 septum formation initiator family protein [Actinomadura litoris]
MAQDDRARSRAARDEPDGDRGRRGNPALTSRAAILAVVVCAIALSLAYPVREYIAQRKEIADLQHKESVARRQVDELAQRKQQLGDKSYIEREATRRLHYCRPDVKCYTVLGGGGEGEQEARKGRPPSKPPWYETLWRSVEAADRPR